MGTHTTVLGVGISDLSTNTKPGPLLWPPSWQTTKRALTRVGEANPLGPYSYDEDGSEASLHIRDIQRESGFDEVYVDTLSALRIFVPHEP